LRSFEDRLGEFDARHVRVVAISVDPPATSREHRRNMRFTFPFLSDAKLDAIRSYDLVHAGAGSGGADIARPAEFLVDSTGTVRWESLTHSIAVRTRPEEVLKAIDDLGLAPAAGS
jgi:peroxiredoxin